MSLYHERWEHETAYLALRHTLLKGRVLRSGDPAGVEQEMWALLALYQALRTAVTDAAQTVPGLDPDRASWTAAVETARELVTAAWNITGPGGDLAGDIGRAVLANLHGPRRPRVCARKVKAPFGRWIAHPAGKPRTIKKITSIATDIDPRHYKPPKPRLTLIDKIRQAAERGEPVDKLLKRLTSWHWSGRILGAHTKANRSDWCDKAAWRPGENAGLRWPFRRRVPGTDRVACGNPPSSALNKPL